MLPRAPHRKGRRKNNFLSRNRKPKGGPFFPESPAMQGKGAAAFTALTHPLRVQLHGRHLLQRDVPGAAVPEAGPAKAAPQRAGSPGRRHGWLSTQFRSFLPYPPLLPPRGCGLPSVGWCFPVTSRFPMPIGENAPCASRERRQSRRAGEEGLRGVLPYMAHTLSVLSGHDVAQQARGRQKETLRQSSPVESG